MLKVAVVIPTYKEELTPLEKISLEQCRKVLGRYPLIFFAPEGKIFSYFEPGDMIAHFPPQYFRSVQTYSKLMMSPFFYDTFKDFEYILIYQLDAFVFYDALEEFCSLGYDYIGAPWPLMYRWRKIISCVGNGGFCLRNVKAHYNLLIKHPDLIAAWNEKNFPEDVFFSHCGRRSDCEFNVAPIDIAYKFSAEYNPARVVKKNAGKLPFGCHAWHNHSPEFYVKNFRRFGYDLRPLKNLMIDDKSDLNNWLTYAAMQRITRRAERGQSISRYLPTKRFASVRVLRSPDAMKILSRLMLEENFLVDKIFIYTEENGFELLRDVERENLPHLILTLNDDDKLTEFIEHKGLSYGEHVLSFRREYLNRCEELFHKLGK